MKKQNSIKKHLTRIILYHSDSLIETFPPYAGINQMFVNMDV